VRCRADEGICGRRRLVRRRRSGFSASISATASSHDAGASGVLRDNHFNRSMHVATADRSVAHFTTTS
jgi:hypothetical protein